MVTIMSVVGGVIFLLIGGILLKYKPMLKFWTAIRQATANFRIAKLYPQFLVNPQYNLVKYGEIIFAIMLIVGGILLILNGLI